MSLREQGAPWARAGRPAAALGSLCPVPGRPGLDVTAGGPQCVRGVSAEAQGGPVRGRTRTAAVCSLGPLCPRTPPARLPGAPGLSGGAPCAAGSPLTSPQARCRPARPPRPRQHGVAPSAAGRGLSPASAGRLRAPAGRERVSGNRPARPVAGPVVTHGDLRWPGGGHRCAFPEDGALGAGPKAGVRRWEQTPPAAPRMFRSREGKRGWHRVTADPGSLTGGSRAVCVPWACMGQHLRGPPTTAGLGRGFARWLCLRVDEARPKVKKRGARNISRRTGRVVTSSGGHRGQARSSALTRVHAEPQALL